LSSHLRQRKRKQRGRAREREREHECHPNEFPRVGIPGLGCRLTECLNRLARHPHAEWWTSQTGVGGVPGTVPVTSETRERERTGSFEEGDTYHV
jgi:hypothetical protein